MRKKEKQDQLTDHCVHNVFTSRQVRFESICIGDNVLKVYL